jgi:hypothetical protein
MKIVKHNFVENYLAFSEDERQDVLLQEVSKAIMMFPNAIKDILNNEKVVPKSNKPNDLLDAIVSNAENSSLMNKLAKISIVTNLELQKSKGVDNDISYRKLMNDKSEFLKENEDILRDSSYKFRTMLTKKGYQKRLAQSVNEYLNMDGQGANKTNMVNTTPNDSKKPISTGTILAIAAVVVVAIVLTKVDK